MKLLKIHPIFRLAMVLFTAFYFSIIAFHLFFAPKFQATSGHNVTVNVRKNNKSIYYFVRNNRATVNENNIGKIYPNSPGVFISLLIDKDPLPVLLRQNTYQAFYLPNSQYSYLSNRVIRI